MLFDRGRERKLESKIEEAERLQREEEEQLITTTIQRINRVIRDHSLRIQARLIPRDTVGLHRLAAASDNDLEEIARSIITELAERKSSDQRPPSPR